MTELVALTVEGGAGLVGLDLPMLEALVYLSIGRCEDPLPASPPGDAGLASLDGLSGLTALQSIETGGQTALTSIARLHELAADGVKFTGTISHNPALPYQDVEHLRDLLGDADADVIHSCGSLGEPESNACMCLGPPQGG